jgi:carboxyl-terminal processing protease
MFPNDPDRPDLDRPETQPWSDGPPPAPPRDAWPAESAPSTPPAGYTAYGIPPTPQVRRPPTRRLSILPLAVVLVAVLAGGALFMSGYTLGRQMALEPGTPPTQADAFDPFWETYDAITKRYAGGEVDRDALIQGAIRGMIEALDDPYSSYLTSQEYRDSLQGISGQFEGIGAEIATEAADGSQGCATLGPDCRLVIVAPLDGSPAERAGLLAGDLVLAADGSALDGLTVDGARDRIRGPKGSTVTLTIERGDDEPFELEITRDVIQQREVRSEALGGGSIGYLRLAGFSDNAAAQLEDEIQAHLDEGRTSLILDLRGNPGGYVTAARDIASEFIADGVIFWEEDAAGGQVATDATAGGIATDPALEIVVLVDRGSASASEIVAGALQDRERATLVGETTFGKGTVQQWQELTGEGGAFRLTIAKWLTPDKRWIHDTGIEPDVAVALPDEIPSGTDPILDRALELLGGTGATGALEPAA